MERLKEAVMEERAVLEPYELAYSDLVKLSSDDHLSSSSLDEFRRLQKVAGEITENLGPTGPGLLSISGVPRSSALRKFLLPLARELALLPNDDRNRILKEHGLGSDVPLKNLDRIVSSFAMQLKYGHCWDLSTSIGGNRKDINASEKTSDHNRRMAESLDDKFKNLGSSFKELGFCMMSLGLSLARICDRAIGGRELENSLLESCTAKGRLIHYHSPLDTKLIKEAVSKKRSKKGRLGNFTSSVHGEKPSESWQQWHYDYGIFTILTCPMFISTCYDTSDEGRIRGMKSCECPSPSEHSYLQIFDPNRNKVCTIRAPPESFIVQVGESADVLSKGRLRSTLHSVCRSVKMESLSRETFVVFLQPAWSKVFSLTDYPTNGQNGPRSAKEFEDDEQKKENEEMHSIVPPLRSRLKNGMTFAEFAQVTTKQYYGGGGLQSNR